MGQQMDMMNKMMLWFFPIMILATGFLWHIGLLVYMVTNNIWTYFQQRYIFAKLDEEEAEELAAKAAAKRDAQEKLAPKPGAKPVNPKKGGKKSAHLPPSAKESAATANESAVDSGNAASKPKSLWADLDAAKSAKSDNSQSGQRSQASKKRKKRKR